MHEPKQQKIKTYRRAKDYNHKNKASGTKRDLCGSHFLVNSLKWMDMEPNEVNSLAEGKLNCYNCKAKLGAFKWSGNQCSCGSWVTPAIQFPKSKVDFKPIAVEKVGILESLVEDLEGLKVDGEEVEVEGEEEEVVEEEEDVVVEEEVVVVEEEVDPRILLHQEWIHASSKEEIEAILNMDECSFTAINNKVFDGPVLLLKALKLVKPESVRVELLESGSTRAIVVLSEEKSIGESIFWEANKATYIRRVKNPSENFLKGGRS